MLYLSVILEDNNDHDLLARANGLSSCVLALDEANYGREAFENETWDK